MEEQDKNQDIIAQYLEGDGEVLKENGVAPHQPQQGSFKNRYWKFISAFLAIVVISIIAIPFIGKYIDREQARVKDEQFAASIQRMHDIQEQLRNDKDGGTTPEETLAMFITALKANNIEKAKLYYSLYPENRSVMFKDRLDQLNKEGKIAALIDLLGKVKEEKNDREKSIAWFSYVEGDKSIVTIELTKAEQFSDIWKIENLAY